MKQELPVGLVLLLIMLLIGAPIMVSANSSDAYVSTASLFTIGTGAELYLFGPLVFRVGVTSRLQSSIGLTVKLNQYQFDYCYLVHNQLPSSHRLSFTVTGKPVLNAAGGIYETGKEFITGLF